LPYTSDCCNCLTWSRSQDGNLPGHKSVSGSLAALVSFNVKLDHHADSDRTALILCHEAVSVDKEVSRKAVAHDEAPSSLEGADLALKTGSNPIPWSRQSMSCDLSCDCATTLIQSDIKLNSLAVSKRRLSFYNLVRDQQEVVSVHKQIAIKCCRIQEAPTLSTAADIASMSLS